MANDSIGVAAAGSPTNYIDNESIATGGSPANVDRQRVRVGGANYTDLADVVTGDTGQGAQVVTGARKEVPFSISADAAVASVDCSNYRWVNVQVTARGGGTATFQGSNDNTNWVSCPLALTTSTGAPTPVTSSSATGAWQGPVPYRYFRVNITGVTGTYAGTVQFFAVPLPQLGAVVSLVSVSGSAIVSTQSGNSASDAASNSISGQYGYMAFAAGYRGDGNWDRLRVPVVFKTATATASGDTALWTPTSGKKFRLMRYMIEVLADAAAAGGADLDIVLRDGTTALPAAFSCFIPSVAGTGYGAVSTGWVDLGNGILSTLANNVLNVNLTATLTGGKVRVVACGTEE